MTVEISTSKTTKMQIILSYEEVEEILKLHILKQIKSSHPKLSKLFNDSNTQPTITLDSNFNGDFKEASIEFECSDYSDEGEQQ